MSIYGLLFIISAISLRLSNSKLVVLLVHVSVEIVILSNSLFLLSILVFHIRHTETKVYTIHLSSSVYSLLFIYQVQRVSLYISSVEGISLYIKCRGYGVVGY